VITDIKDVPKDLRPMARLAWAAGWKILGTSGGHSSWRPPDGTTNIHVSGTPSCRRGVLNAMAKLRAAGLGGQPGRKTRA